MDLLTPLTTLWSNVKNITLPGLLAALAFALLIWPPRTYDRIPTVIDNQLDIAALRVNPILQPGNTTQANIVAYLEQQKRPACMVKEGADSYKILTIPTGLGDRAAVAVRNQLTLDDVDRSLLKCAEEEQALLGIDELVIANVNALVTTRNNERDTIDTAYQKYLIALSPMQGQLKRELADKESEIAELLAEVENLQRAQKERARRVAQLQRVEGEMQKRLGDAGRLRPTQKFDDILSGLSNHIIGFLTLVLAWGLLVDPINQAIFSAVYDNHFDDLWDEVRPGRQSEGKDAYDELDAKIMARQARRTTGVGATIGRWRANETSSAIVILVAFILAGIIFTVFYACGCGSTTNWPTTTTLCAAAGSQPNSVRFTATVSVPGSMEVPSGNVTFRDGATQMGIPVKLVDGVAALPTPSSLFECHDVTAKFEGSQAFQPSMSGEIDKDIVTGLQAPQAQTCTPAIPDLSRVPKVPFWPTFGECLLVTVLAFVVAFFLPSILKTLAPTDIEDSKKNEKASTIPNEQKVEQKLIKNLAANLLNGLDAQEKASTPTGVQKESADFIRELANDLINNLSSGLKTPPLTSEKKLAEALVKKLAADLKTINATDQQKQANELVEQLAKNLVKHLITDSTKTLSCKQKLGRDWKKLSQPRYAIGQGLLLQSDYDALRNSYYSQSLISIGLIIPLFLLVMVLLLTPQFGLAGAALYVVLGLGEVVLVITGVDRRHKFNTDLENQISGAFLKSCGASAQSSSPDVSSQISAALKAAKIVKNTKLGIVPKDNSDDDNGDGDNGGNGGGGGGTSSGGGGGGAKPSATAKNKDAATQKGDDKAASAETSEEHVARQISDALKAAKISKNTDLTIVPADLPTPAPVTPATPSPPASTAPTTAPPTVKSPAASPAPGTTGKS